MCHESCIKNIKKMQHKFCINYFDCKYHNLINICSLSMYTSSSPPTPPLSKEFPPATLPPPPVIIRSGGHCCCGTLPLGLLWSVRLMEQLLSSNTIIDLEEVFTKIILRSELVLTSVGSKSYIS